MKDLLKTVNLLSIEIDILILKIEQSSHRLLKRYSFSVYANLTTSENTAESSSITTLLDECVQGLDAKLFRKTVRTLDNRLLRVLQLNQSAESLGYQIESVHEIDFDSPEPHITIDNHPFEFDQSNHNTYLVFNLDSLEIQTPTSKLAKLELFYLIELKICLQQATLENEQIFSRRCKTARFNVQVGFKIGLDELRFQADKFTFTYFSIGEFHLDSGFNFIDPTQPLIDAKSLLNSSNLFDIERLIRSNSIKFRIDSNPHFYLDPKNGSIFTPNIATMKQSIDLSVDLYLQKQQSTDTKTRLTLRVKRIESPQTINLEIESSRLKLEWVNVFKLALIDRIRFDLFKTFAIDFKCTNLDVRLCSSLFKFNKLTGYLLLHATKLFDPSVYFLVAEKTVNLIMSIGLPNGRLAEIELNVNLMTRENDIEEPIGGEVSRVQLINTTESSLKIGLVSKWALDNSSSLEVVRVKNMLTNNQVLALGYRIELDSTNDLFYLDLDDVLSMELNQLYAFDFAARDPLSAQSSPLVSVYFLRFNPYYSSELDADFKLVKFYANMNGRESVGFNLSKIEIDYLPPPTTRTISSTASPQFSQNIYLINRIKSNRFVKSNLLRRYFKLESDMLYFDSSQLVDIELFGDSLEISLFKFVSDKLSLKVVRIVEFQVRLYTFFY